MTALYPVGYINNINIVNPYNIVKPTPTIINIISPQAKGYLTIINNSPRLQNINQNNISPFVFEEEKTSINSPMKNLFNINTLQIARNTNPYQITTSNFNYNNKRVPHFYAKQGEIQRSNTVNYNPRPTAVPKVNQNYYYNFINNIQIGQKRPISNNGKNFTIKKSNSQLKDTLNNIKIIHVNNPNNNIQVNENNYPNLAKVTKIVTNNKNNYPNLAKVTKIVTNNKNNEKKVNNNKQIIIENNENIQKTNNDNYKKNNELNNNEEKFQIVSKDTKLNNEEHINYQQTKDINQFDNIDEFIQHQEQMNILEKSANNLLDNEKLNPRTQFSYSAHLPNTIRQLNNNNQDNNSIFINNNIYSSVDDKNINYIQPNSALRTEKQEQEQKIKPITPFFTNNGEILSNTKCQEYYRVTSTAPVTSYGYSQNQNVQHRSYMEDEGRVIENLNGDPNKILFCIFDGHGGGQVSKFLQENFGKYMKKIQNYKNIIEGFSTLFKAIDEDIKLLNCPNVGSTATIVYIEKLKESDKRILYCANVGDSRCVLVNKNGVYRLSYDDRVKDPQENERINKNGGIIVNNRVYGQLMLSRSFGDWRIKDVGVIVDPHITRYELSEDDYYCVIASDGIWDVLKDEECSALQKMYVNTGEMSKNIINECLRRKSFDNLSCFVISLK